MDFQKLFGAAADVFTSDSARAAAAKQRKKDMDLLQGLEWDPMYASDRVPTYQKSESPIADSYINSFLLGNNPNATFSGAPNAGIVKGQQQAAQNAQFGTPEERLAREKTLLGAQPWKVTSPADEGKTVHDPQQMQDLRHPILKGTGWTPEYDKKLEAAGLKPLNVGEGRADGDNAGILGDKHESDYYEKLREMLDDPNADKDALAETYVSAKYGADPKNVKVKKKKRPVRDFFGW